MNTENVKGINQTLNLIGLALELSEYDVCLDY